MADFFKELERTFTDVVDGVSKKAGDTLEVQKLKMDVRTLRRNNDRDYIDIGKKIYEKFLQGEVADTECIPLCEAIESREEEIEKKQEDIRRIQEE